MQKQPDPGRSYTLAEWCERRGFSRPTAYRLIRSGEVTTFKVRGKRYVSERADREFVNRREAEATA